jgi:hypothetical protein
MIEGEILADLRRRCGRWADADAIQEAMTRAIELDPSSRGAQLRDVALKCLQDIRREHYDARKRGAAVSRMPLTTSSHSKPSKPSSVSGYASADTAPVLLTPLRRKQVKKPREPRGVVTSRAVDTGFHIIPACDGVILGDRLRFACAQVAAELRIAAFGEPIPARAAELVLELHQELYGVAAEHHWAHVLIDEIGVAKLQSLRNAKLDDHRHVPLESSATLTPTGRAAAHAKPVSVSIKTMRIQSAPGRAMRAVYQQVGDEFVLRGIEHLSRRQVPMTYSAEDIKRAHEILAVVRLRLTLLPWPQTLPSYADNPVLVAWLYRRAGFGGRGGQETVQSRTLCAWLSDANELAMQIERYAKRRAERCTDEEAEVLEEGLLELAGFVRERADLGSNGVTQAGL